MRFRQANRHPGPHAHRSYISRRNHLPGLVSHPCPLPHLTPCPPTSCATSHRHSHPSLPARTLASARPHGKQLPPTLDQSHDVHAHVTIRSGSAGLLACCPPTYMPNCLTPTSHLPTLPACLPTSLTHVLVLSPLPVEPLCDLATCPPAHLLAPLPLPLLCVPCAWLFCLPASPHPLPRVCGWLAVCLCLVVHIWCVSVCVLGWGAHEGGL